MSQEKAQLIAPIGIMTVSGMTATGVITASSFSGNVVGSAKSLVNGANVSVGVITATSFDGNLTGNILRLADSAPNIVAGVTTATSFVGNLTGSVTDLTSQPAITVGMVTATTLEGPVTGNITGNVDGDVTGNVTGNATGNAGGLGVNYNGGWTGAGTSQVRVGVVTATTFYGDGSNLDGVSSGPVSQQSVGITSAATTIDLSNGNLIYATQSSTTTVSFANTSNGNVYFIRTKDATGTARNITWPTGIGWSGGSAPTLKSSPRSTAVQVFLLVTRDMGLTWQGKEVVEDEEETFSLFTWGSNTGGKGGRNENAANQSSPVQVGTNTNWASVTRGYSGNDVNYSGGVKTDGTLWMWGSGNYGQLGLNESGGPSQRSSPIQIGTGTDWAKAVTAAGYAAFATKTDNTLWSWGWQNNTGVLGQNNNVKYSSPTQLGTSTNWGTGEYKLVGGNSNAFAIQDDGSLWSWGYNSNGGLGHNNTTKYSSPVQVGTDTTWSKLGVCTGGQGGCIKTDGTLWTWGWNEKGLLGQNALVDRSSPTQVGTETTWDNITISNTNMMGVKTDGTLWIWGYDEWGDMGLNAYQEPAHRSSPTQLPGTTWNNLGATRYTNFATKTDGTAWSWGRNENGELGLNDRAARSSPTQIPGTAWDEVLGSYLGAMGLQKAG